MVAVAESVVEEATLEWLSTLGYQVSNGLVIGPDGTAPERESYHDVLLRGRLEKALGELNPSLPPDALTSAMAKVGRTETPTLLEENRRLHRYLVEGVPVEVRRRDGSISGEHVRLVNFDDPLANDWLAVNQFTVIEGHANRRPDIVLFLNGLPVGVIELKNPGDENATVQGAFNQLQTSNGLVAIHCSFRAQPKMEEMWTR